MITTFPALPEAARFGGDVSAAATSSGGGVAALLCGGKPERADVTPWASGLITASVPMDRGDRRGSVGVPTAAATPFQPTRHQQADAHGAAPGGGEQRGGGRC